MQFSAAKQVRTLVLACTAIGVVTALYTRAWGITHPTIVALSFLLVVLIVAAISTLQVAVATSLVAIACFNFFFLPPVGTFTIADPQNWAALFALLTVSIIASHLSSQARRRAQEAVARRDELARLFDLTRDILLSTETSGAVGLVARYVARRFGFTRVTICLQGSNGWQFHHSNDDGALLETRDLDAALATARARLEFDARDRSYGGHTRVTLGTGASAWLVPLRLGTQPVGLLVLEGEPIEPGARDAIAGITSIAIDRTFLLEERKEAELVRREADLKSALLASLSHDLKTPVTAATIAASNLGSTWLNEDQTREQAAIVLAELERLGRLFQNILDMARIETAAVSAEREWIQPAELVEAATRHVEHTLRGHRLVVDADADGVFVRLDPRLTASALAHVLENAAQYSPAGSEIAVRAVVGPERLDISVRDHGGGIPAQELDQLFERFFRGSVASKRTFGTGMGLAITRGLMAAQGGRVWAENHPGGGAVFTLALPVERRIRTAIEVESS